MAHRRKTALLATVVALLIATVAAGAAILIMDTATDDVPQAAPTTAVVTEVVTPPVPSTVTVTPAPAPPPAVTITEEPSGSEVIQGGVCQASEVRTFGVDPSGQSLVCGYSGTPTPHWLRHGPDDGGVHVVGEPCDSRVDSVSRDSAGLFIMCGGQTWVTHP
ncbi:MAG: hypothetical protein WBA98_10870 [Gordonia sp. (in: high G+C Gram-positive bacteria)]|uniref:hypothetical protein n=1 Tax=Gordonia sp. (in: high G+C Gram-positive bacteria) TaxID=84139 RepID=UPI003C7541D8